MQIAQTLSKIESKCLLELVLLTIISDKLLYEGNYD